MSTTDKTTQTIDEVVTALTALVSVAPSIIAIVNAIKQNGAVSLADLEALQATRQAAVEEASKALTGE